MKFVSGLVLGIAASVAVVPVVCPVNEIVIKTGETKQSVCEIAYKEYAPCSLENNVTISWDLKSEQSKHFSIERFIDGDVNDAFIISNNLHEVHGYSWRTLDIEGWRDIDEHWFNMTFGQGAIPIFS